MSDTITSDVTWLVADAAENLSGVGPLLGTVKLAVTSSAAVLAVLMLVVAKRSIESS